MELATRDNFKQIVERLKKDRVILNNAEIMRLTGYSKSYITTLLTTDQPPGQKFLQKFNDAFLSDKAVTTEVIQLRRQVAAQKLVIEAQQTTIDSQKELLIHYRKDERKKVR